MAWGGGMPSAGCENCRKVKKRCGLEKPSCARCVKQKKACVGYRDVNQLVIRDESERLRQKYERHQSHTSSPQRTQASSTVSEQPAIGQVIGRSIEKEPEIIVEDVESSTDSDSSDDEIIADSEVPQQEMNLELVQFDPNESIIFLNQNVIRELSQKPEDVATTYFFQQFASSGHWDFIRGFQRQARTRSYLDLAIQACGAAALASARSVERGKDYARMRYVDALALLNQALRDPKQAKRDESLVAVVLLGYYENITCDRRHSVQSWQAHINGAAQLVKLRGKKQFKRPVGRQLFRDARALIISQCIWDDQECPKFMEDYQRELQAQTPDEDSYMADIADRLTWLYFRFAKLRAHLTARKISGLDAAMQGADLERDLIEWSSDAKQGGEFWTYYETEIEDHEYVWDGKVLLYSSHLAATIWNRWRCLRVMLSRVSEMLCRKIVPESERKAYLANFRKTRRQMTDEICATIPPCLGHGGSAINSPCALIAAYGCIWPLFFAGSCALERVGYGAWSIAEGTEAPPSVVHSAAYAQAAWVLRQLKYISEEVGLKWADGVASPLSGEFRLQKPALDTENVFMTTGELEMCSHPLASPIECWVSKVTTPESSPWIENIEEAYRKHHISGGSHCCRASEKWIGGNQHEEWRGRNDTLTKDYTATSLRPIVAQRYTNIGSKANETMATTMDSHRQSRAALSQAIVEGAETLSLP